MSYRILLSGGGTAGSVTPLIALAQEIRQRRPDVEFLFVGTTTGPEKMLVEGADISFQSITSGKLRRYFSWKNISDLWNVWRGYSQARRIIRDWQPQVAVTAGSYVSVPIIKAAQQQGVKTLVHQQDVQPGLANTMMASKADSITTAFEVSTKAFPKNKVVWIGNPIRSEILHGDAERAHMTFHLDKEVPVLLVLGGATGSEKINSVIQSSADQLSKQWQIIHVTGSGQERVASHNPRYQTFTFLTDQLPDVMAAADVVISRAGLGLISELAALGKTSIIIPMPDTHQEKNAEYLSQTAAAIVLNQRDNLASTLLATLDRLQKNPSEAQQLGKSLHKLYRPDALTKLTDMVLDLLPT